jgi:hypothetical protein
MNWKDKYDFWTDRKVAGHVYRFSEYAIKRRLIGGPDRWVIWREFDDPRECAREWRKLCDRAAE